MSACPELQKGECGAAQTGFQLAQQLLWDLSPTRGSSGWLCVTMDCPVLLPPSSSAALQQLPTALRKPTAFPLCQEHSQKAFRAERARFV